MSKPHDPQVTCPNCSANYRWRADQAGRTVPCKQCGTQFAVPDQPGPGLTAEAPAQADPPTDTDTHSDSQTDIQRDTDTDADIYELAEDLDEEPQAPPPAYSPPTEAEQPPTTPPTTTPPPTSTPPTTHTPAPPAVSTQGDTKDASDAPAGEGQHLSEAAKAARREQQRLAAAEAQAAKSWRDFKWLYFSLGALVFFILLVWSMYALRDWLYG